MRQLVLALPLVLTFCATQSAPTPGNGVPDGANYPQTAEQCAAQPTSIWCKPR